MNKIAIRTATAADASGMARVHVKSWHETYRGLVADEVLDRPDGVHRRERLWMRVVTEGADGTTAVAVAERDREIIGTASAGYPRDDDATWPVKLFVLYLLAEFQGSGAGTRLLAPCLASPLVGNQLRIGKWNTADQDVSVMAEASVLYGKEP